MPKYFSLLDVHRAGLDPRYGRAPLDVALAMYRIGQGRASPEDSYLACLHGFARDVQGWARRHPPADARPLWQGWRRWVDAGRPGAIAPDPAATRARSGRVSAEPASGSLRGDCAAARQDPRARREGG